MPSMSLHPTQDIIVKKGNLLLVSLRVKINYEQISGILNHGDKLQVKQDPPLQPSFPISLHSSGKAFAKTVHRTVF